MSKNQQHLEQIHVMISTLEAAQRQCKDAVVEQLILSAMYDAEYLLQTLQEAEMSRMAPQVSDSSGIEPEECCHPL
jgi:hypothetical protein